MHVYIFLYWGTEGEKSSETSNNLFTEFIPQIPSDRRHIYNYVQHHITQES
jgi:hypothetical protein